MATSSSYRDKDDLGRPRPAPLHSGDNWRPSVKLRRNRRTIFIFLAICIIVYLSVHSQWWNDVLLLADGPTPDHTGSPKDDVFSGPPSHNAVPVDASAKPKDPNTSKFTYNGPIRFLGLYETLQKVQQFNYKLRGKHVVFVAANMNTASILAGVACEMSVTKKNVVHLALVGRNEVSIDFFKKANGMTGDACGVIIHDARPDYASISTEERMALSLKSALKYIKDYIAPSVFVSDMDREDIWFQKSIVQKTKDLDITHIKLPHDATTIPWFSKLDSLALSNWYKPSIDIVVHADAHSGQLLRLLKSLKNADYFSAPLPRLFIDLDPNTDETSREFIDKFKWPSKEHLFVRHRIQPKTASLDVDPTSFVESYYPNSKDSAVLFLSANIELSPFYYHFLFYSILEYKYSHTQRGLDPSLIYGISLDAPISRLDGKPFDIKPIKTTSENDKDPSSTPFLYAGPTTHATLFFGSHWRLLHLYIAKRLDKAYTTGVDFTPPIKLSKSIPQWAKYFIEIITAGGYVMLYPNFDPSDSLAVYHTEVESAVTATTAERGVMRMNNILNHLPGQTLPMWTELPILGMDGEKATTWDLVDIAKTYKGKILKNCGGVKKNEGEEDSVDDLFCDGDEEMWAKQREERLEAGQAEKEEEAQKMKDEEAKKQKDEKEKVLRDENAVKEKQAPKKVSDVNKDTAAKTEPTKMEKPPLKRAPRLGKEAKVEPIPQPAAEKKVARKSDGRPQVIHNKIVSLDDLETEPVEVNGEKINVRAP